MHRLPTVDRLWEGLDDTPPEWWENLPTRTASHKMAVRGYRCCDAHGGARCNGVRPRKPHGAGPAKDRR